MPEANARADVRELLRDFESAMQATINQVKGDLERARTVVRDATARLSRNLGSLQEASSAQRDLLQEVSQAFADADGSTRTRFAASSEALMRQFVEEIVRVSRDSMRMVEQLTELSTKVDGITGCADAIDVLARETRFIAFNARIETHRAGDAGRTFKVVADEVKRLANAAGALSNDIRTNVGAVQVELLAVRRTSTGLASHDMSRAIDAHRGLSAAIGKLDNVNSELDSMLATVSTNIAEATRALQFEDMLAQILNATMQRVEGMGALSIRALHVLERGHNGDRVAPLGEIVQSLRALSSQMAVPQHGMEQGSAELF